MRLPTRKSGKYTGQKPDPFITLEKYHNLQKKLHTLKSFSQPHAIKEVKRLALDGDFSENAAYSMAKGRLRGINQRILDIEDHLKRAEIIEDKKNPNKVSLGSRVTIEAEGERKIYQILGSSETDPLNNIISRNSPLGAALLDKKIGDKAKIKLAQKQIIYKIIKIE